MGRIGDILSETRRQFFTGRETELAEFRRLLSEDELSSNVLFIHGPAGQGKTTLVKELMQISRANTCPHLYVNGGEIVPSASGLAEALVKTLGASSLEHFIASIENSAKTVILFIDAYEKIALVDDWLREEFLPGLPSKALVVLSGRNRPSDKWTSDSSWQKLLRLMPLQNFSSGESEEYLNKRKLPGQYHEKILSFTHGHPLALSLIADTYAQNPGRNFSPEESPDVMQTLLSGFLQRAPSAAHRSALEISAIAYVTTQSLLASVLDVDDTDELFNWLKNLSFIEPDKWGLYPHDLAREILVADLKWRNPDWYTLLYNKAKKYYLSRLTGLRGEEQRKFLFKLNYLYKSHPAVGPYFHWKGNNDYRIDLVKPEDIEPLAALTEKFEGPDSVKTFRFWVNHPGVQVYVWRTLVNEHLGFLMSVNLNKLNEREKIKDKDEAMHLIRQYARDNFHLRHGESCVVFRFWMAAGTYQDVSEIQSSIFLFLEQYYLNTPSLAVHLLAVAKPDFWKGFFQYSNLVQIPALNNAGAPGFYMHDWRAMPPLARLKAMGETEEPNTPGPEAVVLSEKEFFESVYGALKDYHSIQKIEGNPLTRSRLVINAAGLNGSKALYGEVLKERLENALKQLELSPRNEKFHRLLYRTFINPVGSQEQTADFLSLPFSTYRRHLKKAVSLIVEILWAEETAR